MQLFFLFSFLQYATAISIYASADTNSTNFLFQTKEEIHRVKAKIYGMKRYIRSLSTNFGPDSTYQLTDGKTCYVCRPGFYKKSDCLSNGTIANCKRCPDGMYSSTYNIAIRCANCSRYCVDKNAELHTVCNSTADMTCRCKSGFYNHSKGSGEFVCLPHSQCPPGQEMHQNGTADSDTQCRQCQPHNFSPHTSLSKCKPCTTCSSDEIVTMPCDGTADTVCKPKGNGLALQIALPTVLTITFTVIIFVTFVLWRKGILIKLKRFCLKNPKETYEKTIEVNSGCITDRKTEKCDQEKGNMQKESKWTKVFIIISSEINVGEWKSVMRTLLANAGDTSADNTIEIICYNNRFDNVKEHIYNCLLKWKQLCDEAVLDDIVQALEADNMLGLAEELQQKFPSLLR